MEIPGGELAQLPELIRGHPSPHGFDLVGACFGTVALDAIVTGAAIAARRRGDRPARRAACTRTATRSRGARCRTCDERRRRARRASVGDALLEPTVIYVRAVLELLRSDVDVRGLAHITSGGLLNLLRLEAEVGYRIDPPLPVPPIFDLIAERARRRARPSCTRSSTWAAASAASCRPSRPRRRSSCSARTTAGRR